jgi:hypothetical protein
LSTARAHDREIKPGAAGRTIDGVNQEPAFPVGPGAIENGRRVYVQRVEIPAE